MYVCIYVCMYACIYLCMYVMYVCVTFKNISCVKINKLNNKIDLCINILNISLSTLLIKHFFKYYIFVIAGTPIHHLDTRTMEFKKDFSKFKLNANIIISEYMSLVFKLFLYCYLTLLSHFSVDIIINIVFIINDNECHTVKYDHVNNKHNFTPLQNISKNIYHISSLIHIYYLLVSDLVHIRH